MIEIEIYIGKGCVGKMWAKYFGQYTSNPCGYEYFSGKRNPRRITRAFAKQLVTDFSQLGTKFFHVAEKQWLTGEEVLELLCLE